MTYIFFLFFFLSDVITASHCNSKALAVNQRFIDIRSLIRIDDQHIKSFKVIPKPGAPILLGLHHDYQLNFEKQGFVKYCDIVMGKNGVFGANVFINNVNYGFKSLFPSHWPYEKIVSIITELCIKRYANMTIRQYCKKMERDTFEVIVKGILIRVVFDRIRFLVVSAYPLIEGHY